MTLTDARVGGNMDRKVKVGLVQFEIVDEWAENMTRAHNILSGAAAGGAELAVLPEIFNMPYDMGLIAERAEPVPEGRTCGELSRWARDLGVYIVGGSIAEAAEDGRYYNTSPVFDPEGRLLACHRKMHLFDVDLPGGVSVKESSVLSPGNQVTVLDVLGLRLGVAICYDLRFPELFRLMALKGVELAVLPGAFNNVSGPHHWEMLLRNRAAENTMYMAGISGLSTPDSAYQAWGHSMLVDPFAEIQVNLGRSQGFGLAEVDPERIKDIRARLPVLQQRRGDVYRLELIEDPHNT